MRARQEAPDEAVGDEAVPGVESDALRMSDMEDRGHADATYYRGWLPEDLPHEQGSGRAKLVLIGVAVGLTAAAAVALKLAYDRRKADKGHRKVVARLEHAREALVSAAAELPELGRDALDRVRNR